MNTLSNSMNQQELFTLLWILIFVLLAVIGVAVYIITKPYRVKARGKRIRKQLEDEFLKEVEEYMQNHSAN